MLSTCLVSGFPSIAVKGHLLQPHQVVLSFDDGPNDNTSPVLLDVLKRNGIKALFFHVGVNLQNVTLMRRFLTEGHCTGVHTMRHKHLPLIGAMEAEQEIDESIQAFQNVTQGEYPRFFRPPYGETNRKITQFVQRREMISFLWDLDSSDWRVHSHLAAQIGGHIHSHGIILMHEYPWTTEELQKIVDTIREHGFEIVHPLELLAIEDLEQLKAHACPSDTQRWCEYTTAREKHEL